MDYHTQTPSLFESLNIELKEAISAVPFELQATVSLIKSWGEACRDEGLQVNRQYLKPENFKTLFLWPQYTAFVFFRQQAELLNEASAEDPSASESLAQENASTLVSRGMTEEDVKALIHAFWTEGFDVNDILNLYFSDSLLRLCVENGHLGLTQFCMEQGAHIHGLHAHESSPFSAALFRGHWDIAQYLLEEGADINQANQFQITPLLRAVAEMNPHRIGWLLNHGADVNGLDRQGKGETPLHYAASNGLFASVKLLVDAGADLSIRNIHGQTALDYAEDQGDEEIADYLRAVELALKEKEALTRITASLPSASSSAHSSNSSHLSSDTLSEPTRPTDPLHTFNPLASSTSNMSDSLESLPSRLGRKTL